MSNANNESTMKFNLDITNLKAGIQEANRNIRLANSEFKAASAGMDDWSKSSDGLSAKLKQLDTNLNSQNAILDDLEKQYKLTVDEMGAGSKAAQDLEIKINNQKATIGKTEQQIKTYNSKLNEVESASKQAENATAKLTSEIKQQESELSALKNDYQNVSIEQGKSSEKAMELENKIRKLSSELQNNKNKLDDTAYSAKDLGDEIEDAGQEAERSEGGFTVLKGALAALAVAGIAKVIDGFKNLATEGDRASKSFQAMTGATAESMAEYNDVMQDLYKNNYGESLDDVARSMAEVKAQTNEVDPSKLKDLTRNAIALRDTFEFDVKESMRAVNMLTKSFGVTGEEAFNLIAQGAQKGLDKNGDLLDTINEYGVHYKQLGYTSEEFFNSLVNGTADGTFSVDKLGDAVKEFGIRTKDTAKTTDEGFQLLGLNADGMRQAFVKGGDSAKTATAQVVEAMKKMDDPVKRNQAGVALWGTMFEDLGYDAVMSLMDVSGEANRTVKTMEEINKVKYADIGSQFAEIGRTIKTDLFLPIAEKALPKLKELANEFKNSDSSKTFINSIANVGGKLIELTLKTIPPVIAVLDGVGKGFDWAKKNADWLVPIVGSLTAAFLLHKTAVIASTAATTGMTGASILSKAAVIAYTTVTNLLTGAITAQTVAQKLLTVAQAATPWGLAAIAIGGVVAGVQLLTKESRENLKVAKEKAEQSEQEVKAWNDITEAQNKAAEAAVAEIDYTKRLKEELMTLVDENGKVKQGYEGRVKYILGELKEGTGVEIALVDGVIQKYQEQMKAIDLLIEKKRAQTIVESGQEAYSEAIKNRTKAIQDLQVAEETHFAKKKELDELTAYAEQIGFENLDLFTALKLRNLEKEVGKYEETYNNKRSILEGYTQTIADQEQLQAWLAEGSAESIAKVNEYVAASYSDKGKKVVLSTQDQIKQEETLLQYSKKLYEETGNENLKIQIKSSEDRLKNLKEELANQKSTLNMSQAEYGEAWKKYTQAGLDGVYGKAQDFNEVGQLLMGKLGEGVTSAEIKGVGSVKKVGENMVATIKGQDYIFNEAGQLLGTTTTQGIDTGMTNQKPLLLKKTLYLKDGVLQEFKNGNWTAAGEDAVYKIAKGTEINGSKVEDKMRILADGTIEVFKNKNWQAVGKAATDGTKLGIDNGSGVVTTAFGRTALNALNKFKSIFGIKSPSRVMKALGLNLTKTTADSVTKNTYLPVKAMSNMASSMLSATNKSLSNVKTSLSGANASLFSSNVSTNQARANTFVANTTPTAKGAQVVNFNQTIQSPKALSRVDLYRETNSLLFTAKRGLQNV